MYSGNVDTFRIPIVDFVNFGPFERRRETAQQVVDGFKNMGFVRLGNNGISIKIIQKVFKSLFGLVPRRIRRSTEHAE